MAVAVAGVRVVGRRMRGLGVRGLAVSAAPGLILVVGVIMVVVLGVDGQQGADERGGQAGRHRSAQRRLSTHTTIERW